MNIYTVQWDNDQGYDEWATSLEWVGLSPNKARKFSRQILERQRHGYCIVSTWDNGKMLGQEYVLLSGKVVGCILCQDTGIRDTRYGRRRCICEMGEDIDEI